MSKEKRRVPKLRFPGFTEDWEQREFSDIFAEVKSGLSRMLSNDDIGLPVVRANNINDGQLNLVDDIKYWYKNDPQGANTNNYLIEQGDILINFINSEAKMGTAAYVTRRPERDTIYTTNILRCKVNDEYNPYFIYSLTFLNSYKNYIASITKPAVNQASFTTVDFKKYSIKIPTVKEQNQIADLIKTFNKLITLHQRKLDNLKLKKKALLQKLFPKNGERYPELRFPGFTDAWEQRKLGEVVTINPKTELPDEFKYVDLESVVGTNLLGFQVIKKENAPSRAQRLASYGDVFYQTVRPYQRNNYLFENVDKDMVFSTGYAQLRSKLDSYFLLTLVQNDNFVKVVLDNCTGTSYPAINGSELGKITVQIPSNEVEANQIGKVFRGIDKSITLHQRKLDHLQLQKKALLQQMFV